LIPEDTIESRPWVETEPKITGSGTETFKILRTETFVLINKVLKPNRNFQIK